MSDADASGWLVLIVEDDKDTADLTSGILSYHKVPHLVASNGEEALAMIAAEKPNIVLLDLAMPEKDGWEVLSIIRSEPGTKDLCVIALTAWHSPRVADLAIERGFDGYFSKPVDAMTFIDEVAAIYAKRPHH